MYQILDIKQSINIDIGIGKYTNIDLDMDVNIDCMYRLKYQYKKRPSYDIHKLVLHYNVTVYFKDTTS